MSPCTYPYKVLYISVAEIKERIDHVFEIVRERIDRVFEMMRGLGDFWATEQPITSSLDFWTIINGFRVSLKVPDELYCKNTNYFPLIRYIDILSSPKYKITDV